MQAYAESYLLFVRRVVRVDDEDDAEAGRADGTVAPAFVFGRLAAGAAADDDDEEDTEAAASLAAATGATNLNMPIRIQHQTCNISLRNTTKFEWYNADNNVIVPFADSPHSSGGGNRHGGGGAHQ